jgi:hypothetical protein
MTFRTSLLASLMLFSLVTGCSDDSPSGMSGNMGNQGERFTCSAQISPSSFDYEVDGNVMHISNATAAQDVARVGTGTGVQGSWLLDEVDDNGFHVTLTMRIEANRVSAIAQCSRSGRRGMATASSSATVTDSAVTIHEANSNVTTF